ncbi:organic solute transporter subunit alpha-like isoform X1 [Amphiura filiformis]|uniref:organic solute transporter subunit alpha-like isoform X1 n=1 Tax=Amphiura filiformis TaxID=82378 RepID=UPI003B20CFE9
MGDNMMMNGNTLPPSPCANMTLTPNSIEMVELMSSSQWTLALLIVCSILAGACLLIYVETIMFILLRLPYGTRRGFLIFLLGCFPVFSLTSILSIYFPRATLMAEFAASAYLAVCVYTFILLIVNYFGGYENMLKILHEERFSLAQAPCCCCRCLPEVALTKKTFHRARIMVMQMTVVRPVALFISAILWTDGLVAMCFETYQTIEVVLNLIATISTLCAIYGLGLFYEMSIRPLRKFYVRPKFFGMKILLLLTNVQAAIFAFLNRFGVIGCLSPLPCDSEFTGNVLNNMLVVFEMPILLVCGRVIISRWLSKTTLGQPFELDDTASQISTKTNGSIKIGNGQVGNGQVGNGQVGNGHAIRAKRSSRSSHASGGSGGSSVDKVSINSAKSAPPATMMHINDGMEIDETPASPALSTMSVNGSVEPAAMPGLRVITSQTSTTSLV